MVTNAQIEANRLNSQASTGPRTEAGVLVGSILALRWAIVDQRRRCPACLRLLTNPVRFGQPSQTFLEWYGTEFICGKGHGLLHVPEIPTSCYSTPTVAVAQSIVVRFVLTARTDYR